MSSRSRPAFATDWPAAVTMAATATSWNGPVKLNIASLSNCSANGKVNRCGTFGGMLGSSGSTVPRCTTCTPLSGDGNVGTFGGDDRLPAVSPSSAAVYPSTTTRIAGSITAGAPLREISAFTSPSLAVERSITRKQSRVPTPTGVGVEAMPLTTTSRFQDPGATLDGTSTMAVTMAEPVAIPIVEKLWVRR